MSFESRKLPKENQREYKLLPDSLYTLRLEEWSRQFRVSRLSDEWEESILELIPSRLKDEHHQHSVETILREVRNIYENDMRNCAIEFVIPRSLADVAAEKREQRYLRKKARDSTLQSEKRCWNVAKQCEKLANTFFLSHSIMRHIIATAICTLPRIIVNLDEYRNSGLFEISELQETLMNGTRRCAALIRNDYYGEIVRFMGNHVEFIKSLDKKKLNVFMGCATNLFVQQILNVMRRTIDELIKALDDYRYRGPKLNFQLVWNEPNLTIEPAISQVYEMWHGLVDGIESIADNLLPFREAAISGNSEVHEKKSSKAIKVKLPEWYMKKSHETIDKIMKEIFGPLDKYLKDMFEQFAGIVSSPEIKQNIIDLASKGRNFDLHCSNVKTLNVYYDKASDMIDRVFYDIGTLDQSLAKIQLKEYIADMKNILIVSMLRHHEVYNREICSEFQALHDEMLDIPKNVEALFDLTEKMSYASRILVDKLEKRIRTSIRMLARLFEITGDMTEEHIHLNSRTVNWLTEIKPTFGKSNVLCEAMKSELEDDLQRRINDLNVDVEEVIPKFVILDDMDDISRVEDYVRHLGILVRNIERLDQRIQKINVEEKLLKFPLTPFPIVEELREALMPVYELNKLSCQWKRDHSVWLGGPFEYINAQDVQNKTLNYQKRFRELNTSIRAKIKLDAQSTTSKPFVYTGGSVDDPDPMQQPAPLKLCYQVLNDVDDFEQYIDLVACICNPALRDRHWDEMSLIRDPTGRLSIKPDAGTTLRKLIALDLKKDLAQYQAVSLGADKELALVCRLEEMTAQWNNVDFTVVPSKSEIETDEGIKRSDVLWTFVNLNDIEILMEEHFIGIREMRVSYFVKPIETELGEFFSSLKRVHDVIEIWLRIQDEWLDLEPVFRFLSLLDRDDCNDDHYSSADDADESSPEERLTKQVATLFVRVNDALREIKQAIIGSPEFPSISNNSVRLLRLLRESTDNIGTLRETVGNYVQEKRSSYPRLFFISDREAIDLLFEPEFTIKMKLLVNKCFTGVKNLKFFEDSNNCSVISIIDNYDQELSLANGNLRAENKQSSISSFVAIEEAITHTLRNSILICFCSLNEEETSNQRQERHSILIDCETSVAAICSWRIYCTSRIEIAFLGANIYEELTSHCREQYSILSKLLERLKSKITRRERQTSVCLIIQVRQELDVTKLIIETSKTTAGWSGTISAREDFNWKAQIRCYAEEDNVMVTILNTTVSYGYEFNACERPPINTPLTDRCYRTLMEAHRNRLYGVLFGPAATGKTECVKNLARILGVPLRIINCTANSFNYNYVSNIFKGLIGCSPCWLCFKNMDLPSIAMLSILAQKMTDISRILSCSDDQSIIQFHGSSLNVGDPKSCFISGTVSLGRTRNPQSASSTLQTLPDSLRIFFRPVGMWYPDTIKIVEIELFAEGFIDATNLAKKIRLVEKYSIDQFTRNLAEITTEGSVGNLFPESAIPRYDFGMRTTKSIIKAACALKNHYPNESEDVLLLRALVDVIFPKLINSDAIIFQHIIQDIFPDVALPPPNYSNLLSAFERAQEDWQKKCLRDDDNLSRNLKMIQLFEILFMRHAIIVVGPSLSGKSTIIDTLANSLTLLGKEGIDSLPTVESVRINHNALNNEELFGSFAGDSGKLFWKDGIATRMLRSFICGKEGRRNRNVESYWRWLVFDGSLETHFLDKLTTLLDDNKTLFLSSGESIIINGSVSIIFETMSMKKASPAVISRCGIIYVAEQTMSWRGKIRRWIVQQRSLLPPRQAGDKEGEDRYEKYLESLMNWALSACLTFVCEKSDHQTSISMKLSSKNHMIVSVLQLLTMYLREALVEKAENISQDETLNYSPSPSSSTEGSRWKSSYFYVWSQASLMMSIVWGLGGFLDKNAAIALDEFCISIWREKGSSERTKQFPRPKSAGSFECSPPSEGLIREHMYMFSGTGTWRHWSDVLKRDCFSKDGSWIPQPGPTSCVPTTESLAYSNLLHLHIKYRVPFLLMGETATGKTVYARHLLKSKIRQSTHVGNFLSLNSVKPTGLEAQRTFISKMTKLRRGLYGIGKERLLINFVDDLNVVSIDENPGSRAAVELIRQYLDTGIWYNIENGTEIHLSNVMFLGAITMDRRNEWNYKWKEAQRFFSHFNLYNVYSPSNESMNKIYSTVLMANWKINMFTPDISGMVGNIVDATLDIYSTILQKLRPIPSKFHYQFTSRDVARVISGCSLIHKESVESKTTLVRLWVHETLRVYADRMVDERDADWLLTDIRRIVKTHFKDQLETVFEQLLKNKQDKLTIAKLRHFFFSDFMYDCDGADVGETETGQTTQRSTDVRKSNEKKRYEEITCAWDVLKTKATTYLRRYNASNSIAKRKLDFALVTGMLEHLIRICRVLSIPGASLLMMCFGGTGRRSLTALAAYIKSQNLQELSCRIGSESMLENCETWKADLKTACKSCARGVSSGRLSDIKDCTFFLSDRHITEAGPRFLVDLCDLMKSGQVQDLFTEQEMEEMVENSRLLAQKGDRNLEISSNAVTDFFFNKCQEKIHFVLYFDRARVKKSWITRSSIFNSIIDHCNIDCYEYWPEEAFIEIANEFMRDMEMSADVKRKAVVASKYFYDSVNGMWNEEHPESKNKEFSFEEQPVSISNLLPVAAYIHMVKLYSLTMTNKRNEIKKTRERYLNGLDKLQLAGERVREMKAALTRLRPELELSAKETADTMRKIEKENVTVENATMQVKREEEAANRIAEIAGALKEECEADLAIAIPILEDAIEALNTLKPTDITLVKAMKNPPDTVKLVLAAVCVMMAVPPDRLTDPATGKKTVDYWSPSKRILGDMNFLQYLKDYDKDNIPSSVMVTINKTYMTDESFLPHIVAKASSAAEGLCRWVRAMVSYDQVAKVVAPKKEKLADAEKECNECAQFLNDKRKSLAALNDKLAALNVVLEATLAKKLQLENEVANCTEKLAKAEGLITSLAGEKDRWLGSAETLKQSYDFLAGDLLISCGIVAFLGPLNADGRNRHVMRWIKRLRELPIPTSGESYDFVKSLETDIQINEWNFLGLAKNPFSHGNAAIANNSLLCPLFVDPQNQANLWIRQTEAANNLKVVKSTDSNWLADIKIGIEEGLPVLVENLDKPIYFQTTDLDDILSNLLRIRDDSRTVARMNNEIEESSIRSSKTNFRMYMTCRVSLREAAFDSHVYKRMCIINFSLGKEALDDRLLGMVVSREKPELQDEFDKLALESARNRRVLTQEEDKILGILSNTSVNIIEDDRAIAALDYSKNLSIEIMRKEEATRVKNCEMEEFRRTYRPFTEYCGALFDTIAGLANLNHMYRFSLDWFTRLYVRSIDASMKSVILEKRLKYLKASFTKTLNSSVTNAILDDHKLLYSFVLSIKALLDSGKINEEEVELFRRSVTFRRQERGNASQDLSNVISIAQKLSEALPTVFGKLPESFRINSTNWMNYCSRKSSVPNKNELPSPWNDQLTNFQQLILMSSVKPEKTMEIVKRLIDDTLKTKLNRADEYSIANSFEESSCLTPLIFILPSYVNVPGVIDGWAETMGYSSKVVRFSMGGEDDVAFNFEVDDSIERARKYGGWVLLENCNLATDSWLAKLERTCEMLDPSDTSLTFRLWLTSYPTNRFPISILQNSTKIHWEASSDRIKNTFLLSYRSEPLNNPEFYNSCPGKNKQFAKLIYSLCFFHSIVRGREKFGKRAWNVPSFEFYHSDLSISLGLLQMFLHESNEEVPNNFDTLTYIIGECYYGGRILDPIDRNCLNKILRDYCNPRIVRATLNYVFAVTPDGHRYFVPNRTEYIDYVKHINDCLPSGDVPPQIFCLDDNAGIMKNCESADEFIDSFSTFLAEDSTGNYYQDSAISVDTDQSKKTILITIIEDIRSKFFEKDDSPPLDAVRVRNDYPIVHDEPLNALLIMEVEIYNRLVETMTNNIVDVERTFDAGLAPFSLTSSVVEELVRDLINYRIPTEWISTTKHRGEESLPQFMDYLLKRKQFLDDWIKKGHNGVASFWLGGLTDCRKFISTVKLMFARKIKTSLSDLGIDYKISNIQVPQSEFCENIDFKCKDASKTFDSSEISPMISIHGLFLSGAQWNVERSTLVESLPTLYWCPMPVIHLHPNSCAKKQIVNNDLQKLKNSQYYSCPLVDASTAIDSLPNFFGALSNDYVTNIPLKSIDISPEYWIKRATALYCKLQAM